MITSYKKAKSFYKSSEKADFQNQNPLDLIKTMVSELRKSMEIVVSSTGTKEYRTLRSKHFSRSLVIIYTLQTTLDFEKGENLATKLFQIYEYCRQQIIKCFKDQIIEGIKKAISALNDIFESKKENHA